MPSDPKSSPAATLLLARRLPPPPRSETPPRQIPAQIRPDRRPAGHCAGQEGPGTGEGGAAATSAAEECATKYKPFTSGSAETRRPLSVRDVRSAARGHAPIRPRLPQTRPSAGHALSLRRRRRGRDNGGDGRDASSIPTPPVCPRATPGPPHSHPGAAPCAQSLVQRLPELRQLFQCPDTLWGNLSLIPDLNLPRDIPSGLYHPEIFILPQ